MKSDVCVLCVCVGGGGRVKGHIQYFQWGKGPYIPICHYDAISIDGFRAIESWSIEGKRKAYIPPIKTKCDV